MVRRDGGPVKIEVPGKAWSSPVVADGKIHLTTAVEEGGKVRLGARCHSLADGSLLWEREIFERRRLRSTRRTAMLRPRHLCGRKGLRALRP